MGVDEASICHNGHELEVKVKSIQDTLGMPVLIEHYINGREFKVGIIGSGEGLQCFMLEDIRGDGTGLGDEYLGFGAKSSGDYGKVYQDIHSKAFKVLKEMCIKVYKHFEPVDYGTFDIRMDEVGNFYIIEFNADATLHPDRTLAKCCELSGIAYDGLIQMIMTSVIERWEGTNG